jgi:hypothetical protein
VTPRRIVGLILVIVGLVSLLWGGISWTRERTVLDIGPLEARTEERETIPLPPILGGVALAAGAVLLFMRQRTRVP